MKLSDSQVQTLRHALATAAAVPELAGRIEGLYADVTKAVETRKPRCDISGRCCQFEKFGHLLFVTTAELAVFGQRLGPNAVGIDRFNGCQFQIGGKCSVHTIRPFGCRIYFCDPTAQDWQQDQYESFHLQLRRLHDELAIPYLYVEWRQGLRALEKTSLPF